MAVSHCRSVLALVAATSFTSVNGHGYISKPAARNVRRGEWNAANGNGPEVCGDRGSRWGAYYLDVFDGVRQTYTAGEVVDFEMVITVHHYGHFELSICDRRINSSMRDPEACLRQWPLQRVDPQESHPDCEPNDVRGDCQPLDTAHPERWYLPPSRVPRGTPEVHLMRFRIPAELECAECTLQWRWWTANSCVPAEGYGCFYEQLAEAGWNETEWHGFYSGKPCGSLPGERGCGEEFRNCADIRVQRTAPLASASLQNTGARQLAATSLLHSAAARQLASISIAAH